MYENLIKEEYSNSTKLILEEILEQIKIGIALRKQRTADQLSLTDFQKVAGIAPGLIRKYEHCDIWIQPNHKNIIMAYLNGFFDKQIKTLKKKERHQKVEQPSIK